MKPFNRLKLSMAILLSVLLFQCGAKNVGKDYSLDDSQGKGLLVVSLTKSGIIGYNINAHFRDVNNQREFHLDVAPTFGLDWKGPSLEEARKDRYIPEDNPIGRLALLELPEGEYEFYKWRGNLSNTSFWTNKNFNKKFKVVAGKAVYIGNIHAHFERTGNPLIPFRFPYELRTEITDESERDLKLFHQKCQKINSDQVMLEVIDTEAWINQW